MPSAPALALEVLPAQEGDALLLSVPGRRRMHHVLIDAGTKSTAPTVRQRLAALPERRLDLLVVTHIDSDHIGGMTKLLADPGFDLGIDDVWFNGYHHLPHAPAERGVADAERLTDLLTGRTGTRRKLPWNRAWRGAAVMRPNDPQRPSTALTLPVIELPCGLKLTLLSPTPKALSRLVKDWERYLDQLHRGRPSPQTRQPEVPLTRGVSLEEVALRKTQDDLAAPNGSSIAFLAEFGGRALLFCADAHPDVLVPAVGALARQRAAAASSRATAPPRLKVDLVKLPHHGSCANVTLDLLKVVCADHYVVSTSGRRFKHPDDEAMARVILHGRPSARATPTLWFNHASATTQPWLQPSMAEQYRYRAAGPRDAARGVRIELPV